MMDNEPILLNLGEKYPGLLSVLDPLAVAASAIINSFTAGGKLLVCGNGGSCSDSDHIVGELMKGFEKKRPIGEDLKAGFEAIDHERGRYIADRLQQGLPALSLATHSALTTAIGNDIDPTLVFAQQVAGYGQKGDILIGISTSGNAQNVIDALITAQAKGMITIGLTGQSGGRMKPFCDILINVPGNCPADVQEYHLPVYHALCKIVENHFFTI